MARTIGHAAHDASSWAVVLSVLVRLSFIAVTTLWAPGESHAISFDLEFRGSTYQVTGSDAYDGLVVEFQSGPLLSTQIASRSTAVRCEHWTT